MLRDCLILPEFEVILSMQGENIEPNPAKFHQWIEESIIVEYPLYVNSGGDLINTAHRVIKTRALVELPSGHMTSVSYGRIKFII